MSTPDYLPSVFICGGKKRTQSFMPSESEVSSTRDERNCPQGVGLADSQHRTDRSLWWSGLAPVEGILESSRRPEHGKHGAHSFSLTLLCHSSALLNCRLYFES